MRYFIKRFIILLLAFFTAVITSHSLELSLPGNFFIAKAQAQEPALPVSFFDVSASSGYSFARQLVNGPDGELWFLEDVLTSQRYQTDGIIGRITNDGVITKYTVAGLTGSSKIAVGPDGNFWYTQPDQNMIGKITPQGEITDYQLSDTGCTKPTGITVGPDNKIWFVQSVYRYSSYCKESYLTQLTSDEVITEYVIPGQNLGHNIFTGADGNLWISGGIENTLIKVTIDPVTYTIYQMPNYLQTMIPGENNDLWFSSYPDYNKIGQFKFDGSYTEFTVNVNTFILALAVDQNNDLWFMDISADKLYKLTDNGEITTYPLTEKLNNVTQMTFGPDGNLWFVQSQSGLVGKIDLSSISQTPMPEPTIPSFNGQYFANKNLSGIPVITRNDEKVDFSWYDGSPDASIPVNEFSARWTKTSNFDEGSYEFTVTADDGFRLYIDNELILDKWVDQSPTTYKVQKSLIAGEHTVKFEYYEAWGGATAKMDYSKVIYPIPLPTEPTDYTAKFWNIADNGKTPAIPTRTPDLQRTDTTIDYDWKDQKPAAEINAGFFVAQWTKTAMFEAGTYNFNTLSDDGIRVYVDDQLVIDQWNDHSTTAHTGEKIMTAGLHTIRVEYYEKWGDATAKFNIQKFVTEPNPEPSDNYITKFWNIPDNTAVPEIPAKAPVVTRTDATIDFDWKDQSPAIGMNPGFFVAQFVKTTAFEEGTYTFKTTSDDGIRVFIDNELVLDQWNDHSETTHSVEKQMTSGNHTIKVEYYEKWGDAVAQFSFAKNSSNPGVSEQPAIAHMVYDDQMQNGWVNWSWDSLVNFTAAVNPFKGSNHIAWNSTNKWAGLYFHKDSGFNTANLKEITFAVRATKANQKMELILLDDTNTVIGAPKKLADYGGDPTVGEYKIYVIPLSDLGGSNKVIKGFHLKDINGEMTNEIYVDSVGFTAL